MVLWKIVVFCMLNDLVLTKNAKKELWRENKFDYWSKDPSARGDPLLNSHKFSITKLAQILSRCPNSVFIGPGNAQLWEMDDYFDLGAAAMLNILNSFGVTNVNAVELMQTMTKRGELHFDNTMQSRIGAAQMLENAIQISDAQLRFGIARHVYELIQSKPLVILWKVNVFPGPRNLLQTMVRKLRR